MTGFGTDLKHERESRGLTLEALAAETRVQLRHLAALEQDQYEALPGGLFRRSIVRAYLAAAGLEEQVWLPRFDRSLKQHTEQHAQTSGSAAVSTSEAWAAFAENVRRNRSGAAPSHRFRWMGVLLLMLAVLALAWAVWRFIVHPRLAP